MADHKHQSTIVGVFALTSLILIFVLTMMFSGGTSILDRSYEVNVQFAESVDGISIGQPVTLIGKRVGETKEISFWDENDVSRGIRITMKIDDKYGIPANAKVEVVPGLIQFGRPPIRIVLPETGAAADLLAKDGSAKLLGNVMNMQDQVVPREMQDSILRVADEMAELAQSLKPVAMNLETLLAPRSINTVDNQELVANVATVIERFDVTLRNFNTIIADEENLTNFRASLANARAMSEEGAEAMANIRVVSARSQEVAANATKLLQEMTDRMDQMSSVLAKMDNAFASLNDRRGTIGSLLNDNRLYEEMILAARRLTKALDDVREVLDIAKKGELRIKAF